jgi:hypothetical protein
VGILRSGWVGGAQPVCEGKGLAGGQVVDGDFVSLPVGAGEEDVAADGHGIIRSSLQAEAALLRHRQPREGKAPTRGLVVGAGVGRPRPTIT